jgi:hypothetical protein
MPDALPAAMWTVGEITAARDHVAALLAEAGIANFRFEVSDGDEVWQIHVECGGERAWYSTTLEVDRPVLEASMRDGDARRRLCEEWARKFEGCRTDA